VNNSLLSSQYTENGKTERLTGKVVPMSVGLKVSLGFGL
jgi:hypothetical protein